MKVPDLAKDRLTLAVQARAQELELFWKRSLFFWGFIGAAFVGYAAAIGKSASVGLLMACFGFICALAWTLANRGSKFWQENWEQKVQRFEVEVVGQLFAFQEPRLPKGWFSAYRFSVSRLTIALSDFTVLVWAALLIREGIRAYGVSIGDFDTRFMFLLAAGGTLTFGIGMFLASRVRSQEGSDDRASVEEHSAASSPSAVAAAPPNEPWQL